VTNAPPLWKASVTFSKTDAPNIAALFELAPPRPQAVLIAEDPFRDEAVVEALYGTMPDGAFLEQLAGKFVNVTLLPDQDWIKLSQQGLPPVRAGRFFVYGAHDRGEVPCSVIPIRIEAGLAFGTGHHETTALCLRAISSLGKARRFRNVLDLGCGSGVLAIAAAKLWHARVMASDIDPVAVSVARQNVRENGVTGIRTSVAEGLFHPAIANASPYDLVLANILAAPLTKLAPQIARALAPRGFAILSGLLRWQEALVLSFHRPHGLVLCATCRDGAWSALVLERVVRAG